jgi:hypothetical protein
LAVLRREQAHAISDSCGADLDVIPQEFAELEARL